MTIAIYERVSSKSQDHAAQHVELEAWAAGKSVSYYRDKFTGKSMDRPAMNRLLADLRAGKVKTLVVWRLDRLGRTAKGLVALLDELAERRVNFVSVRDGIDLATPSGRLIANVLASVAAYETEVRGERIAAGLAAKRAKVAAGIDTWNSGRPRGANHKTTPEVRRQALAMKAAGRPVAEIGRVLRLSRPTVYAVLRGLAEA